jgi:hypothetical protein
VDCRWKTEQLMPRLFFALGASLLLMGCYYDIESDLYGPPSACDTTAVTFAGHIAPLVASECAGCHSGASPDGGLTLDGHASISAAFVDGAALDRVSRSAGSSGAMPPSGPLPSCDVTVLRAWVDAGAPNN